MAGKRRKKRKRILTVVLSLSVLFGAVAALHFLTVTELYTENTKYCDGRAVLTACFPEVNDRRMISVMKNVLFGGPGNRAFSTELELLSFQALKVKVSEKEAAAQIGFDGSYLVLTAEGVVLGTLSERSEDLREIEGIDILSFEAFSLAETAEEKALSDALLISGFLDKYGFSEPVLRYENGAFYLPYGEITVSLGQAENLDTKLTELKNQLPELHDLHGTLHLETLDSPESTSAFYFTVE